MDPLIRSVNGVTAARANASSVFQLSSLSFSLSNGDGTELRRDGDVPVGVNISV